MNNIDVELVPNWFWQGHSRDLESLFDESNGLALPSNTISGLSMSEDEKNVYVEVSVPGIDTKDIEVTFDKGILWVKGEKKAEEKKEYAKRKFYRKASSSFSYRVSVPREVDPNKEPEAVYKNGVIKLILVKTEASKPRKIIVKSVS